MTDHHPDPPETLADLRALSDEDIVSLHDREFASSTKAANLYVGELNRRAAERDAQASRELARKANQLALIAIAIAVLAVVVAVVWRWPPY